MSLLSIITAVESFLDSTNRLLRQLDVRGVHKMKAHASMDAIGKVEIICKKFHFIARQLLDRHNNRDTLKIEDEYDAQDLIHSLLILFFDDIRPEEWTPSYAGSSSRIDFLLKDEEIVVEIKKTRKGLADKELGDQLIIDAARYKTHPDCRTLICFVYDPERMVRNPKGLRKDLEKLSSESLKVIVFIEPS